MNNFTSKHASFLTFLLAFSLSAFGQTLKPVAELVQKTGDNGTAFQIVRPFSTAPVTSTEAFRVTENAQFLTLDVEAAAEIGIAKPKALNFFLPYNGELLEMEMVRSEIFTEDFMVTTSETPSQAVKFEHGAHYRGILVGENNSLVAVSFFPDGEMMGIISNSAFGNLVLGKLDIRENRMNYILYADKDLKAQMPGDCHTPENDGLKLPPGVQSTAPTVAGCVKIYLEADYELFQNKVTVQATVNYLAGVFNQVATLYANEQITFNLSQLFVWTTADTYSTTSASTVLSQFVAGRPSFNGNIAHLTGLGGSNLGGIGYVDVLCFTGYNYSYGQITASYSTVPTYSWTVEVMTHEIGHNLGSNHTHWCGWTGGALDNCYTTEGGCAAGPAPTNGGTIMSYCHLVSAGINFSNGFGSLPGNLIRTKVSAATCLAATCPTQACTAPSALTLSNVTSTGATIAWTAVTGATSYTLRYRVVGAASWTTLTNSVSPKVLTGLTAGAKYEVTICTNCSAGSSDFVNGIIFNTTGTATCAAPTSVTASAITSSTATASWAAVSGAASYGVSIKLTSSSTWGTPTTTTTTSVNLSGLTASTSYDVRVQTTCTNSILSSYTQTTFVTSAAAVGCGVPTNLASSAVASTTATLSWTAVSGATSYQLSYKKSTTSTWTTTTNSSTTSRNLTGLTASTLYNVRVLAVCSSGNSAYATLDFTTTAAATCGVPTNLASSAVTSTTATLSWTAVTGATSYQLSYKKSTTSTWTSTTNSSTTSRNLTGLTASTLYNVRVLAVCSNGNSAYATLNFTTTAAATCPVPTNVAASNITNTGALISWTAASGAVSYKLKYKKNSATNWSTEATVSGLNYTLAGLTKNVLYNVQVRTLCAGTVYSTAVQVNFTTTNLKPQNMPISGNSDENGVENVVIEDTEVAIPQPAVMNFYKATDAIEINLTPNPASEFVKIELNFEQEKSVSVEVMDVLGKRMMKEFAEGQNLEIQLAINELREGVYFVRVSENGKILGVRRLVKK